MATDKILTQIETLELDSAKYGSDLNERLTNIDQNFNNILSSGFVKGDKGNQTGTYGFIICNDNYTNKTILNTEKSGKDIINMMADTIGVDVKDLLTIKSSIVFTYENIDKDKDRLTGSLPYVYMDPKRKDININNENDDKSCVIYYDGSSEKFLKSNPFPTIYYDGVEEKFYWKIGGEKTNIEALGPKGNDGNKGDSVILGKIDPNSLAQNNENRKYIALDYIAEWHHSDSNSSPILMWQKVTTDNVQENAMCIVLIEDSFYISPIVYYDVNADGKKLPCVFVGTDNVFDLIRNQVVLKNLLNSVGDGLGAGDLSCLFIPDKLDGTYHSIWNDAAGVLNMGMTDQVNNLTQNNVKNPDQNQLNIKYTNVNAKIANVSELHSKSDISINNGVLSINDGYIRMDNGDINVGKGTIIDDGNVKVLEAIAIDPKDPEDPEGATNINISNVQPHIQGLSISTTNKDYEYNRSILTSKLSVPQIIDRINNSNYNSGVSYRVSRAIPSDFYEMYLTDGDTEVVKRIPWNGGVYDQLYPSNNMQDTWSSYRITLNSFHNDNGGWIPVSDDDSRSINIDSRYSLERFINSSPTNKKDPMGGHGWTYNDNLLNDFVEGVDEVDITYTFSTQINIGESDNSIDLAKNITFLFCDRTCPFLESYDNSKSKIPWQDAINAYGSTSGVADIVLSGHQLIRLANSKITIQLQDKDINSENNELFKKESEVQLSNLTGIITTRSPYMGANNLYTIVIPFRNCFSENELNTLNNSIEKCSNGTLNINIDLTLKKGLYYRDGENIYGPEEVSGHGQFPLLSYTGLTKPDYICMVPSNKTTSIKLREMGPIQQGNPDVINLKQISFSLEGIVDAIGNYPVAMYVDQRVYFSNINDYLNGDGLFSIHFPKFNSALNYDDGVTVENNGEEVGFIKIEKNGEEEYRDTYLYTIIDDDKVKNSSEIVKIKEKIDAVKNKNTAYICPDGIIFSDSPKTYLSIYNKCKEQEVNGSKSFEYDYILEIGNPGGEDNSTTNSFIYISDLINIVRELRPGNYTS